MNTKIMLSEDQIPKQWYNIIPDMPGPLAPVINPRTLQPVTPEDMLAIFPMALIEQEMSPNRWIDIPDAVRTIYKLWRPSPLYRAHRLEQALVEQRPLVVALQQRHEPSDDARVPLDPEVVLRDAQVPVVEPEPHLPVDLDKRLPPLVHKRDDTNRFRFDSRLEGGERLELLRVPPFDEGQRQSADAAQRRRCGYQELHELQLPGAA